MIEQKFQPILKVKSQVRNQSPQLVKKAKHFECRATKLQFAIDKSEAIFMATAFVIHLKDMASTKKSQLVVHLGQMAKHLQISSFIVTTFAFIVQ